MIGTVAKQNTVVVHLGVERRDGRLRIVSTKTRHGAEPEAFLFTLEGLSGDDGHPDREDDEILRLIEDEIAAMAPEL